MAADEYASANAIARHSLDEAEAAAYRDLHAAAPLGAAERSRLRMRLVAHRRAMGAKLVREVPRLPRFVTDFDVAVAREEHAAEVGFLMAAALELPATAEPAFAALVGRPGWVCHVALCDGEPVAAGALRVADGVGWLGLAATRPDRRGRGAHSALIATRLSAATTAGCWSVVTEAPAASRAPGRAARRRGGTWHGPGSGSRTSVDLVASRPRRGAGPRAGSCGVSAGSRVRRKWRPHRPTASMRVLGGLTLEAGGEPRPCPNGARPRAAGLLRAEPGARPRARLTAALRRRPRPQRPATLRQAVSALRQAVARRGGRRDHGRPRPLRPAPGPIWSTSSSCGAWPAAATSRARSSSRPATSCPARRRVGVAARGAHHDESASCCRRADAATAGGDIAAAVALTRRARSTTPSERRRGH